MWIWACMAQRGIRAFGGVFGGVFGGGVGGVVVDLKAEFLHFRTSHLKGAKKTCQRENGPSTSSEKKYGRDTKQTKARLVLPTYL